MHAFYRNYAGTAFNGNHSSIEHEHTKRENENGSKGNREKEEEMNGDKMKLTHTFHITKAHSIKCMDSLVHPFRHTFIVIFIPCNSSRIKENQITAQLILLPNHKAIEQIKVVKFEPIKYCTHMIKVIIFTTRKKR